MTEICLSPVGMLDEWPMAQSFKRARRLRLGSLYTKAAKVFDVAEAL